MWTIKCSRTIPKEIQSEVALSMETFLAREDLGFKNISTLEQSLKRVHEQSQFLQSKKKWVVIGLGGSSLGTKALAQALMPFTWREKILFLDNVDGHTIDGLLNRMNKPDEWGWILCSKSGSTIEVVSLFDYCYQFLKGQKKHDITSDTLVITEEKDSVLRQFSQTRKCPSLPVPMDVGGRFSVMTAVGLAPLLALDINGGQVIHGFSNALNDQKNLKTLIGGLYHSHVLKEFNFYSFQYSDRLECWGLWLQQLWSESLSKKLKRDGSTAPINSTLVPCRGASDQHSVLQQVIEGAEKKLMVFHRVKSSESSQMSIKESFFENQRMIQKGLGHLLSAEAHATEEASIDAGIGTIGLSTEELTEKSLGYLMGLWMLSVGVLGELFDINAFDQPGVESGKVIARRVLDESY